MEEEGFGAGDDATDDEAELAGFEEFNKMVENQDLVKADFVKCYNRFRVWMTKMVKKMRKDWMTIWEVMMMMMKTMMTKMLRKRD